MQLCQSGVKTNLTTLPSSSIHLPEKHYPPAGQSDKCTDDLRTSSFVRGYITARMLAPIIKHPDTNQTCPSHCSEWGSNPRLGLVQVSLITKSCQITLLLTMVHTIIRAHASYIKIIHIKT